jgi:predicted hydrocarbon binding protein
MALDIIREQRMIRTLFYSLVQSADLLVDNKSKCEKFISSVAKFIKERALREDETRDQKEIVTDLLEMLGWKSITVNYNQDDGQGIVTLGKNRFFVNDIAESDGTLLVLQALIEGIGHFLLKSPVKTKATLSLKSDSYYNIQFSRILAAVKEEEVEEKPSLVPIKVEEMGIHSTLTIDKIFYPIFSKDLPDFMLFETIWKVITESYVANFSADASDPVNEALKNPSMTNLSLIIMKLTENEKEEEIINMAEIVGEFFVKILSTKMTDPIITKLQSTLQDKHANNYLIYYDCRFFCAEKKFVNRCTFIRGMWVGILNEIFGRQVIIKELYHAGKRDRYCMIELVPEESSQ